MSNRIQKRESNFTQVSNSFLRDSNISFKAKGLFCYMFSMSEDWNFTLKSIATQQNDGLASIISAMKELKEFSYVVYTKHTDGTGTYFLDDEPKVENPNLENPNVENPNFGKSTRIKKSQLDKNKNTKGEDAEEIYEHYKNKLKASKSKQTSLNNITKWLNEYSKEDLIKAIDNYSIEKKVLNDTEMKFIKECSNFFGVKSESKSFFIDFINREIEKQKDNHNVQGAEGYQF